MTEAVATVAGRLPAVSVTGLGNTGLSGAGMTLGSFLDARGSLIYGAHPNADPTRADDPFYPESPHCHPWLPFTTDRAAALAGPLAWLAARHFLPDAEEIEDSPRLPNRHAIGRCERAATTIRFALGAVPFAAIGYDHG